MSETSESPLSVELVGIAEVQRILGKAGLEAWAMAVLEQLAKEIKIMATPYPSEGPWNQPGPYPARWYQRHFGSRWARVDGTVGGSNKSEQMQKQWVVERRGAQWVIGNRASYSPYVMGKEQTGVHSAHGWRKLEEIAQEVMADKLTTLAEAELEKQIRKAGAGSPATEE